MSIRSMTGDPPASPFPSRRCPVPTPVRMFIYFAGAIRIAEPAAPPMKNRSWTLTAKVKTNGRRNRGRDHGLWWRCRRYHCYLDKGVPVFDYNYFERHTVLKGDKPLPAGEATITVDFAYLGGKGEAGKGADITLSVNGEKVAEGRMEATVGGRFGIDTFGIGEDSGQPVTHDYTAPFKFTGEIEKVVVEVK